LCTTWTPCRATTWARSSRRRSLPDPSRPQRLRPDRAGDDPRSAHRIPGELQTEKGGRRRFERGARPGVPPGAAGRGLDVPHPDRG
jgi:hypothetical protein